VFARFAHLLLIVSLFGIGGCQGHESTQSDSTRSEAEIRQVLDRWTKAFGARDLDGIMSIYAQDVVAYDIGGPPLAYVGKDAYRKDYQGFLAQYDGPIEVEFRDLHISASGDLALVNCLEQFSGTIKGQKTTIWLRATSGFKKTGGVWLDFHDHVSVPADFGTGKALVDLKP
jgi:uncharacterized protein (TIGR02246 family)